MHSFKFFWRFNVPSGFRALEISEVPQFAIAIPVLCAKLLTQNSISAKLFSPYIKYYPVELLPKCTPAHSKGLYSSPITILEQEPHRKLYLLVAALVPFQEFVLQLLGGSV